MTCCPTCGQSVAAGFANPAEVVAAVRLSPYERRIIERLARSFGKLVSTDALIAAVYDDDINGGPDNDRQNIAVFVHRIRRKIEPHGLTIDGRKSFTGGRRLIWTEVAP